MKIGVTSTAYELCCGSAFKSIYSSCIILMANCGISSPFVAYDFSNGLSNVIVKLY